MTTRVVVADDQTLVRAGFRLLVDSAPVILTTFDLDEYVYQALRAGVSGFVLKDIPSADLLAAIRIVAAGDALPAPSVTRRLIAEFARRPGTTLVAPAALGVLTDREREVLALVAEGLSNGDIAEHLVVSPATSKTHVSRLLTKLGARDRARLVGSPTRAASSSPGRRRAASSSPGRRRAAAYSLRPRRECHPRADDGGRPDPYLPGVKHALDVIGLDQETGRGRRRTRCLSSPSRGSASASGVSSRSTASVSRWSRGR